MPRSDDATALLSLGALRAQQGQLHAAAALLREGLARDPSAAEGHNNLGMVLQGLDRGEEAIACFDKAIGVRPGYAIALNNLGMALAALGRTAEAIEHYQRAIAIRPGYPEALNNLGGALYALGRHGEAIERFWEVLSLRPGFVQARVNLAHAQADLGETTDAIATYRDVLGRQPQNAMVHLNLADLLLKTQDYVAATGHYERACAIRPDLADARAGLGVALQEMGRIEEAGKCFARAIAIDPDCPRYYLRLAQNTKLPDDDENLARLLALAGDLVRIPEHERISLHFALGKALADIGRQAEAFEHLVAGNALKRCSIQYDEARETGQLRRIETVFDEALIRRAAGHGDPSTAPIFIIGMPRSGSTLVEQILGSHSRVLAVGEVRTFGESVRAVGVRVDGHRFPDSVSRWSDDRFGAVGREYVRRLSAQASGGGRSAPIARITDKMLSNFRYAGLIHLALPNARIIHTRRDPIDTCLSCFSLLFADLPFTYDLGELGRRYQAYARLMAHWRNVLPAGTVLDVRYEDLVADPEKESRRVIAYCGLDWEDACLDFHKAERPVRTASVVQVRKAIYTHSVGRWRPDEDKLRPLLQGLGLASGHTGGPEHP